MPSFADYKTMLGDNVKQGRVRKEQADEIMEGTWDEDVTSCVAYFYDQFHDDEFDIFTNLHPEDSPTKIPIDIKLVKAQNNSLNKDQQSYHIMLRPSYVMNIPYYEKEFEKYNPKFPVPLYCDIPDEKGIYRRWMICGEYSFYDTQFPAYQVLPCDYKLKWVYKNKQYQSWCILRSQSSYNSGVKSNDNIEIVANQCSTWLPLNDYTQTLYYNQRVCIGAMLEEHPTVWKCTKVETVNPNAVVRLTWLQTQFNDKTDYVEKDDNGNVIGIWCDYFTTDVTPDPPDSPTAPDTPSTTITCSITYSGIKPTVMVGKTKTLTANFYDNDGNTVTPLSGTWSFSDTTLLENIADLTVNPVKVRVVDNIDNSGKIFTATFTTDDGKVTASQDIQIIG